MNKLKDFYLDIIEEAEKEIIPNSAIYETNKEELANNIADATVTLIIKFTRWYDNASYNTINSLLNGDETGEEVLKILLNYYITQQ